jgi:hypothetical protein
MAESKSDICEASTDKQNSEKEKQEQNIEFLKNGWTYSATLEASAILPSNVDSAGLQMFIKQVTAVLPKVPKINSHAFILIEFQEDIKEIVFNFKPVTFEEQLLFVERGAVDTQECTKRLKDQTGTEHWSLLILVNWPTEKVSRLLTLIFPKVLIEITHPVI